MPHTEIPRDEWRARVDHLLGMLIGATIEYAERRDIPLEGMYLEGATPADAARATVRCLDALDNPEL